MDTFLVVVVVVGVHLVALLLVMSCVVAWPRTLVFTVVFFSVLPFVFVVAFTAMEGPSGDGLWVGIVVVVGVVVVAVGTATAAAAIARVLILAFTFMGIRRLGCKSAVAAGIFCSFVCMRGWCCCCGDLLVLECVLFSDTSTFEVFELPTPNTNCFFAAGRGGGGDGDGGESGNRVDLGGSNRGLSQRITGLEVSAVCFVSAWLRVLLLLRPDRRGESASSEE